MTNQDFFHIAIDGPVAAGKGTTARLLAQKLDFLYVDTGAMYRTVAVLAFREGIDLKDEERLSVATASAQIELYEERNMETLAISLKIILNGEDISEQIRTPEVDQAVSVVATLAQVRAVLVEKQQEIASLQNVVMEGRDITYRVLPDAQLKIFLTATPEKRAERRYKEYLARGREISLTEVMTDLQQRDDRDFHRQADPLKIVPEAWVIDTTDLTIEETVDLIIERVNQLRSAS